MSRYIQKDMFVEVGKGISPNFQEVLELLYAKGEVLAFAPDTEETKIMINWMSVKFPLLKVQVMYLIFWLIIIFGINCLADAKFYWSLSPQLNFSLELYWLCHVLRVLFES